VGCASAAAQGGRCGPGALSGAAGSFAGPLLADLGFHRNLVAHSVVGGLASMAAGGNFANGAVTAAFGYLFNQALMPTVSPDAMTHILDRHGLGAQLRDPSAGEFTAEYATPAGILELVAGAWSAANPNDFRPGNRPGTVIMEREVYLKDTVTGAVVPYPVGKSGVYKGTGGLPTNAYVVIMNSNLQVITAYPIDPSQLLGPKRP